MANCSEMSLSKFQSFGTPFRVVHLKDTFLSISFIIWPFYYFVDLRPAVSLTGDLSAAEKWSQVEPSWDVVPGQRPAGTVRVSPLATVSVNKPAASNIFVESRLPEALKWTHLENITAVDDQHKNENGQIINKGTKKVSFKWTILNGVLKLWN